jgi:hypothetical protein
MTDVLTPLTDEQQCRAAFNELRDQWADGASVHRDVHVGFRGGGYSCTLFWRPNENVWGVFETPPELLRYWICWGTEPPARSVGIIVETNPPLIDFDRRCSGAFLSDADGRACLAHSGRVGGGRKGIGKQAFRGYTELRDWVVVRWPDGKHTDYLRLGRIGESELFAGVSAFVHEVAGFKEWAVSE